MHLPAVPAAAELHARDDLNAVFFSRTLSLGHAVYAVVIGYRNGAQAELVCVSHGLRRRFRAVGDIRMNMKVYFSHCFIVSIIFSASP